MSQNNHVTTNWEELWMTEVVQRYSNGEWRQARVYKNLNNAKRYGYRNGKLYRAKLVWEEIVSESDNS